eukprot:10609428-Lingulodinium_polyedra.AAC.1
MALAPGQRASGPAALRPDGGRPAGPVATPASASWSACSAPTSSTPGPSRTDLVPGSVLRALGLAQPPSLLGRASGAPLTASLPAEGAAVATS